MQDPKKSPKSPSGHHRTICRAISSQLRHVSTVRKNLLSSNISYTCPHNMVNFGPLAAEIVSLVWGTPGNFNEFRVLAALLHSTLIVVISQTLRRWTESATYIRQGGHHVGHWPTFLVLNCFLFVYTSYAVECRIAAVKLDQLCRSQFAFQKCMLDRCTLSMHYAGCVSWTGTCTPVSYLYSTESTSMSLLCVLFAVVLLGC